MKKTNKKTKGHIFTREEIGEYHPISFSEVRKEWRKDPAFLEAKKKTALEYALIQQIVKSRIKKNISQKMLARRLGTGQSAISRLESGTYNPSFKFLQKLAKALDSELVISFK